jgi:hypothetical protein
VTPGTPSQLPALGDWWHLPSGRTASIRRIEGDGFQAVIVVRYVDENGAMTPGEVHLSISYVVKGRKVSHG